MNMDIINNPIFVSMNDDDVYIDRRFVSIFDKWIIFGNITWEPPRDIAYEFDSELEEYGDEWNILIEGYIKGLVEYPSEEKYINAIRCSRSMPSLAREIIKCALLKNSQDAYSFYSLLCNFWVSGDPKDLPRRASRSAISQCKYYECIDDVVGISCNVNGVDSVYGIIERLVCDISNCRWTENGWECMNLNLLSSNIIKLPLIYKVYGNLSVSNNILISLEGCPEKVAGNFTCVKCGLTSLEGGPKIVMGKYNCSSNNLKSLKGIARGFEYAHIKGNPDLYSNQDYANFTINIKRRE